MWFYKKNKINNKKNLAHRRHLISSPMQTVAPIPKPTEMDNFEWRG